jgi:hypothetical protein
MMRAMLYEAAQAMLKALDPTRPIREADISLYQFH